MSNKRNKGIIILMIITAIIIIGIAGYFGVYKYSVNKQAQKELVGIIEEQKDFEIDMEKEPVAPEVPEDDITKIEEIDDSALRQGNEFKWLAEHMPIFSPARIVSISGTIDELDERKFIFNTNESVKTVQNFYKRELDAKEDWRKVAVTGVDSSAIIKYTDELHSITVSIFEYNNQTRFILEYTFLMEEL